MGADLRKLTGAEPGKFIVLYQGGVGPSRYLEPIIKAMVYAPRGIFVIRGPGIDRYGINYRRLAGSLGIAERVFCLDPVPSQRVVIEASSADAGIWSLENLCKNFEFALPNKVFEYLAAGLPILVADYPETRKLVDTYGVGICFDPDSPASIAEAINTMANDPDVLQIYKRKIPAALKANRPEVEWARVLAIYENIEANQSL
jgi:glycosyltransferase involved in cell wall biosynthesis